MLKSSSAAKKLILVTFVYSVLGRADLFKTPSSQDKLALTRNFIALTDPADRAKATIMVHERFEVSWVGYLRNKRK